MRTAVVVPSWNGRRWLPGLFTSLGAQEHAPDLVVVVDNGSADGSLEWLRARASPPARALRALGSAEDVGSVATKMLLLEAPGVVDDAGDVLRRDGVAEQRGHGRPDGPRFDAPGEVWGASAGAAVYRLGALLDAGGFDERFFAYLEDVDLALRLRLAGWRCLYEPCVALHGRHGSDGAGARPIDALVARNTLLIVAKAFPARWLGPVAYRQVAWAWAALGERRLREHLGGVASALPAVPAMLAERRRLRRSAVVPVEVAVPHRPWRGPAAGGHRGSPE